MDILSRVKKKAVIFCVVTLTFNLFFIMLSLKEITNTACAFTDITSDDALEAKIVAEELSKEKRAEKKAIMSDLFREAKATYEAKDYQTAQEMFEKIVKIDPQNKTAKHYIDLCKDAMKKEVPETISGSLIKRGRSNYNNKQYAAAVSDFETALLSNPNDAEAKAWLAKAREMEVLSAEKNTTIEQRKKVVATRGVAGEEKLTTEQKMMLDVDKGWLPPERRQREEVQIEEVISPEEIAEQEAKKKLAEKMSGIKVPAISVTDADVQDLIRQLMEMTGVTIVIDERALSELTKEQPIKISLTTANEMPLTDILDIAFKTTQLGYKIEPNYVWVSSKTNVEKEELVTRTYRLKYGVRQTRRVELKEFETTSSK